MIQNWEEDGDVFKKLVEHLPVIVFVYQYPRVVYANPICERLHGHALQEMQGMNFWDFVRPNEREQVRPGGPPVCEGNQLPQPTKITILRKNGEVIWVDAFFIVTALGGKKPPLLEG